MYVLQSGNTYVNGTNYRMHVFDSSGSLKRRILPYKYVGWNGTPKCTEQGNSSYKFDMYDDKIYILDSGWYKASIKVLSKTGQCLQIKHGIAHPRHGSVTQLGLESIAVT